MEFFSCPYYERRGNHGNCGVSPQQANFTGIFAEAAGLPDAAFYANVCFCEPITTVEEP
jgi:hypothetical protein